MTSIRLVARIIRMLPLVNAGGWHDEKVVNVSIFAGYLSLVLHAEGIGSCIFRKETVRKSKYNDLIKARCNIPENEQIILELAIGNYKEEFCVPVSYRRKAQDILRYRES